MNGIVLVWTVLLVGAAGGMVAWRMTGRWPCADRLDRMLHGIFASLVALAIFSCLAFAAWALGLPLSLGSVANGTMGDLYWLGPVSMIFAALLGNMLRNGSANGCR